VEHGRDHDERLSKFKQTRSNNTPPDPPDDEAPDPGTLLGSAWAPTERAARREALRHRLEQVAGVSVAGLVGVEAWVRPPEVTRERLDEIARLADEQLDQEPVREP
jgi:hypothetical protein